MPHDVFRAIPGPSVVLLSLALGLGSGCGEPTGPVGATLVVTASTAGIDPDLDGYAMVLDDQAGRRLARNATLTVLDLEPGEHRVELDDFASNCSVEGENPRTLDVKAGAKVTVTFYVTCAATTGALAVHTITTGEVLDPDGYAAVIDGQGSRRLVPNGSQTISGLAPGVHRVDVQDLITNCHLEGEPTRTVTVEAGATADLTLSVACVARAVYISVGTTGQAPDPDGYAVAVDGNESQAIGVSGSLDVGGLLDGEHTVTLSGLASYCDAAENPRTIQLSESSTAVRFDVVCPGPPVEGRILFNGPAGSEVHVFVMSPDGSGRRDLTPHANGFSAQWSPDRSRIVFETTRNGRSELFVMNADGSHPTRFAAGRAPAWSPDGARIAFIVDAGLTVMDLDGSHRHLLPTGRRSNAPSWSPDGRMIAYDQENPARCGLIQFDVLCARDVYIVNTDGTGGRLLTAAPDGLTWSTGPAWSPDGTAIAFVRSKFSTSEADLYLVAPDGTHLVQLTATSRLVERNPVWSPDGRALAFGLSAGAAALDIALMPREGGTPISLLSGAGEQLATSWR